MKIQITKRENNPTKATAEIAIDGEPVFRVRIVDGRYGFFIVFPEPTSFDMRKRMEIQNAVLKAYRNTI
jgi:DNA-binding cell septation regulator SpoVG